MPSFDSSTFLAITNAFHNNIEWIDAFITLFAGLCKRIGAWVQYGPITHLGAGLNYTAGPGISFMHMNPENTHAIIHIVYFLHRWGPEGCTNPSNMVVRSFLTNTCSSYWLKLARWAPRDWQKKSASTQVRFIRTFSSWNTWRSESRCQIIIYLMWRAALI